LKFNHCSSPRISRCQRWASWETFCMGISRYKSLLAAPFLVAAISTSAVAQPAAPPKPGNPSGARTTTDAANPSLQQVLERLSKVERELDTLKKGGKVPLDKKDQRLIVGLESPYLGSPYYSQTNPRAFAARLLFINLTDEKIVIKSDD